ncbi:hypothetical protein EON81_26675 [bacterium]|nr:MAG: hypothetical protein EON81_26675 [bacterium]
MLLIVRFIIDPFGLLTLVAVVLSVLGCIEWAKAKGLSAWWGAIGLITWIGWIILYFVPGRAASGFPGDTNTNYPR